jgi:organic hydroperoxide reductase OsmC/OhrA
MSEHVCRVLWAREGKNFERADYSRDHRVEFPGGQSLRASSAASYGGDGQRVDPEQLLTAALSTCHMLTFLAVCANRGLVVDHYEDDAVGYLEKNNEGKMAVVRAQLRPKVRFAAPSPSLEDYRAFHERAHKACFIANSVKTDVSVQPELLS